MNLPKPTHVYIGRQKRCGCCTAIISDYGDKETANSVASVIKSGRYIERVDWQTYKNVVSQEPGFMDCHCKELSTQPELF